MLKTTLTILEPLLKEILKNDELVDNAKKYLAIYKSGYWIYPGLLKHKLKVSIKSIYLILNKMEEMGLIRHYYEVICPHCTKSIGEYYPDLDSIPEYVECDNCGNGIKILAVKSAYMIYQVNEDV